MVLSDKFSRNFHYVRLSVTDRCNFKCQYCLPNGFKNKCNEEDLSINEIENLVTALVELGIWKIRLTGGEPTLRKDLTEIIKTIRKFPQIRELSLTTNGYKLHRCLDEYIAAGLTGLNISIDSLDQEQFAKVTGVDRLSVIRPVIDQALESTLKSVKINTVLLKASYKKELERFSEFLKDKAITVRFIELMETGDNREYFNNNYVSANIVSEFLKNNGWKQIVKSEGSGPAIEFRHNEFTGKFGIIAPYSKDFCNGCNRLRFTARGELRLCLFGDGNYSLRHLLQNKNSKTQLQEEIIRVLTEKPKAHQLKESRTGNIINLSQIGG